MTSESHTQHLARRFINVFLAAISFTYNPPLSASQPYTTSTSRAHWVGMIARAIFTPRGEMRIDLSERDKEFFVPPYATIKRNPVLPLVFASRLIHSNSIYALFPRGFFLCSLHYIAQYGFICSLDMRTTFCSHPQWVVCPKGSSHTT